MLFSRLFLLLKFIILLSQGRMGGRHLSNGFREKMTEGGMGEGGREGEHQRIF